MAVYEQWLAHRRLSLEEGRRPALEQIGRVFKKDVFPSLRHLTIYEITRAHLLDIIGKVEKRGSLSVAEKLRTWFTQLFTYATVAIPNMGDNPSRDLEWSRCPCRRSNTTRSCACTSCRSCCRHCASTAGA